MSSSPSSPSKPSPDPTPRTGPNPKPCTVCRRRKVRCDKVKPFCSNCVRTNSVCTYDEPSQATDPYGQQRLESAADLQKRITRLENLVENMAGVSLSSQGGDELNECTARRYKLASPSVAPTTNCRDSPKIPVGTSIFGAGSSVYIDPGTWVELFDQVEQLESYLKEDWHHNSYKSLSRPSSLLFSSAHPTPPSEPSLHPSLAQSDLLINIFFDSVERFIGILHEGTFRRELDQYRMKRLAFHDEFEALLFSIYAITIASMKSEKVGRLLGESRDFLLDRYQYAAERALDGANLLRSRKLLTFQAFLYYLTFLYQRGCYEEATALVGLAIRIAQRLGLHRDPIHFTCSPWVVEMRRRMWNHLFYLDSKGLEIQGAELGLSAFSDTVLPKNANNREWNGNRFRSKMAEPISRVGWTDMTYPILRNELTSFLQMVVRMSDLQEYEQYQKAMAKKREEIELRYLRLFDATEPFQRLVASLTRMTLSQIDLVARQVYVKFGRPSNEFKLRLFIHAIELLEEVERIETEAAKFGWDWIIRSSMQWHAIAIILTNLCTRFTGTEVERAWRQVDVVSRRHLDNNLVHAPIWQPLHQLREQAIFERQLREHPESGPAERPDAAHTILTVSQGELGEATATYGVMDFPMTDLAGQEFYSLFPADEGGWE